MLSQQPGAPCSPDKSSLKLLVVGFAPYTEQMYPHLYEFVQEMRRYADVAYFGHGYRGYEWFLLEQQLRMVSFVDLMRPVRLWSKTRKIGSFLREFRRHKQQLQQMLAEAYDAVIAIDHVALNTVARYAQQSTRLIFWSHDILCQDGLFYTAYLVRRILRQNIKNLKRFKLIMIQDQQRAAILDSLLFSHQIPKVYFPIALRDDDDSRQIACQKAEHPPTDMIHLIQQNAAEERGIQDLLDIYQQLDPHIMLTFQGSCSLTLGQLMAAYPRQPTFYPFQPSLRAMRQNLASGDIGFICYQIQDLNHFFISRASGQLVEFLKLGMPVIIYRSAELGAFVEQHTVGVFIQHINDVSQAIRTIQANYAGYARNARKIYEDCFRLEPYCQTLYEKIITL
jgi:hypothetical protein